MVLIHGAGGNKNELAPLALEIGPEHSYWHFDMLGHGGRPEPEAYGVQEIAEDLIRGLDRAGVGRAFFLGYSFGGLVAYYIANRFPDRVIGCCALSTKIQYDQATVDRLLKMLDPERLTRLGLRVEPWIAAIHAKHRMLLTTVDAQGGPSIVEEWLSGVTCPVLAINGRRDSMVSVEETKRVADLVPQSRCTIFEGTAHPISALPLTAVADEIRAFVRDVEVMAPV